MPRRPLRFRCCTKTGELAVDITESVFERPDAAIVRLTAPDTPAPFSALL